MRHVNRGPVWVALLVSCGWPEAAVIQLAGALISRERWPRTHRRGPGSPWDHVYLVPRPRPLTGRWMGVERIAPTRADPENHD